MSIVPIVLITTIVGRMRRGPKTMLDTAIAMALTAIWYFSTLCAIG